MAEVEIPSYFLCPISLQVMNNPVTLCTGITYDRGSIEHWLFTKKQETCPVTNQLLSDFSLIPNHTLHRLIQSWCVQHGHDKFSPPHAHTDEEYIAEVLENSEQSLQELKSMVMESKRSRQLIESSIQVLGFLVSVVGIKDEALSILSVLDISEEMLKEIVATNDTLFDTLTRILPASNDAARVDAIVLLKKLIPVITPSRLANIEEVVFEEIVRVLSEIVSIQATKAALEALHGLCPWGKNRVKAISARAVHVLIEHLMDEKKDERVVGMVLMVLDGLCMCAEGRAEIVGNAAGIASVSEKIYMNSSTGRERAVKILHTICKFSSSGSVLKEMIEVGAVEKLCMIFFIDCSSKTKKRVSEILRMHSCVWRKSPCFSPQILALCPN